MNLDRTLNRTGVVSVNSAADPCDNTSTSQWIRVALPHIRGRARAGDGAISMRRGGGLGRRRATAGGAAVGTIVVAALADCSRAPSNSPAGTDTKGAQSLNTAQFSDADAAARTTLTPAPGSFLQGKTTVTMLASTTPDNGDVNPYAIWPVTADMGSLHAGDVLVDNFNNKSNNQGTGTTIVNVHPDKSVSVFASLPQNLPGCPGGVCLTTPIVVLKDGRVLVA